MVLFLSHFNVCIILCDYANSGITVANIFNGRGVDLYASLERQVFVTFGLIGNRLIVRRRPVLRYISTLNVPTMTSFVLNGL